MAVNVNRGVYILILILVVSCNDSGSFPSIISNKVTEKHKNIEGTRLYIIPPPGYSTAAGYAGIRKSSAVLQVYDQQDGNYYTSTAIYSKDKFEREGSQVEAYKDVTVCGYKGKYLFMKTNTNTCVYTLAFGDSTFSVTVLGIYPEDDAEAAKELKTALLSVAYDKNKKKDPLTEAPFTVNDSVTNFKFVKTAGANYIFTINGQDIQADSTAPFVMISHVNGIQDGQIAGIADTLFNRIDNEHSVMGKTIKYIPENKINGCPAYARVVYGTINNVPNMVYEMAILKDKDLILFIGDAKNNYETYNAEFLKLSHTIKVK